MEVQPEVVEVVPRSEQLNPTATACEKSTLPNLEQLGRQRPNNVLSGLREVAFIFSIAMSQFLAEYLAGGRGVVGLDWRWIGLDIHGYPLDWR